MIKVLGIGSPFGDDKVGWKVIDLLKKPTYNKLVIEKHDRPGIRLLDLMRGAHIVYLIDAVVTGAPLGTIYKLAKNEIKELKTVISSHDIGIAQALEIGEELGDLPQEIIFYGIEIGVNNYDTLSSLVNMSAQKVAENIKFLLKNNML